MTQRAEPTVADGQQFAGELVAAVDESVPQAASGVYFVVAAVVMFNPDAVTKSIRALLTGRGRPFHWNREGSDTRLRMLDLIAETSIGSAVRWQSSARTAQLKTRATLLDAITEWASDQGVDHLVIESSDEVINVRDRHVIARRLAATSTARSVVYDHRSKAEPILWMADAVAGAAGEYLVGKDDRFYQRLLDAGAIDPI